MDELAQQVWLGVLRADPDTSTDAFRGYLALQANSAFDKWLVARKREAMRLDDVPEAHAAYRVTPEPVDWSDVQERMAALTQAEAQVVVAQGHGYTNEEIAAWLGKTPGGIKQLAWMARKRLRGEAPPAWTPEQRKAQTEAAGKVGGIRSGVSRGERLTPEQRQEIARNAALARYKRRDTKEPQC